MYSYMVDPVFSDDQGAVLVGMLFMTPPFNLIVQFVIYSIVKVIEVIRAKRNKQHTPEHIE